MVVVQYNKIMEHAYVVTHKLNHASALIFLVLSLTYNMNTYTCFPRSGRPFLP